MFKVLPPVVVILKHKKKVSSFTSVQPELVHVLHPVSYISVHFLAAVSAAVRKYPVAATVELQLGGRDDVFGTQFPPQPTEVHFRHFPYPVDYASL